MTTPTALFRSLMFNDVYSTCKGLILCMFTFQGNDTSDPDATLIFPDGVVAKNNTALSIVGIKHQATGVYLVTLGFKATKFLGGITSVMDVSKAITTECVQNVDLDSDDFCTVELAFNDAGGPEDPDAATPIMCWLAFQK